MKSKAGVRAVFTPSPPPILRSIMSRGIFTLVLGVLAVFFTACPQPDGNDEPKAVSLFNLSGHVTPPVIGAAPDVAPIDTAQYTAAKAWKTAGGVPMEGNFSAASVYKAVVSLTAKSGFTFDGVAANAFTYSGASVTNPAGRGNSLEVTIIFPQTGGVTALALDSYVTAPVRGAIPKTADIRTTQYIGTVAWKTANGAHSGKFAEETVYVAELTLTVKSGYTFDGVAANTFTYRDATVTHAEGSGSSLTVTITFPPTGAREEITVTSTEGLSGLSELLSAKNGGTSADDPVDLAVKLVLSEDNWSALLSAIDSGGKYVSLDLAACTPSDSNILGGLRPNGNFAPMPSISDGKDKIVSLTLPDQASGIVAGSDEVPTFSNFSALKTISIENITAIGGSAFSGCPLTSVTMSALLSEAAFNNASFDSNIEWTIKGNGGWWSTPPENGALLVYNGTKLVYGRAASGSIALPAITIIGEGAFSSCAALTSVSFPAAETIGEGAFSYCSGLTSVYLPEAETIGGSAFFYCAALTSVSFPAAETIGEGAFSYCSGLTSVSFPAAETIGEGAFSYCSGLTSVSFPAAETIGEGAFSRCSALTSVTLQAAKDIGEGAFSSCSALASVTLLAAETIGEGAFSGCPLTSVTMPASLSEEAFNNAGFNSKIEWTINGNGDWSAPSENRALLVYNGTKLVYGKGASDSITLPSSITSISRGAFSGCPLTGVTMLASLSLSEAEFNNAGFNSKIVWNVTGNSNWSTLENGALLVYNGNKLVYGRAASGSITLPSSITSIGCQAFSGCNTLTSIILEGATPPTLETNIFSGVSRGITVRIPLGSEGAYGASSYSNASASDNWGNALRGRGWNGTNYLHGSVNTSVTLVFETYEP